MSKPTYPDPTNGAGPVAYGTCANGGDPSIPTAYAQPVVLDVPQSIPTFEVPLPSNARPGTSFYFNIEGMQKQMIVPDGARGGMSLRCMLVPPNAMPGGDVIVMTPEGEMAITIPPGMRAGEVLVVDMGTDLRQWVGSDEGSSGGCCGRVCYCITDVTKRLLPIIVCVGMCVLLYALFASIPHRPHGYYGGGYGYGGYGAQPVHQGVSTYHQHLLANQNVAYGSVPSPPIDPSLKDEFPGKEDGFERGTDESGKEIYRYEQQGQVYIIPANDYYSWRAQHPYEHGHLSHELLNILLFSAMFHALAYPRGMYYGGGGMFFGRPGMPYYSSAAYQSHFSSPVRGANGAVSYPRAGGAGGVGGAAGGRVGTPVAQARPVASGRPVGGAGGVPRGTPVAAARPAARPSYTSGGSRGWSSARSSFRGGSRGRG